MVRETSSNLVASVLREVRHLRGEAAELRKEVRFLRSVVVDRQEPNSELSRCGPPVLWHRLLAAIHRSAELSRINRTLTRTEVEESIAVADTIDAIEQECNQRGETGILALAREEMRREIDTAVHSPEAAKES